MGKGYNDIYKEEDEWTIRNEYTPEEIKKIILDTNEESNRIGKIIKNVDDGSIDEWLMSTAGKRWTSVEEWIGSYHELELSRIFRVPFDIGQDRSDEGDMSGNNVFVLESHFEELEQDNPEVIKRQDRMNLLRQRMSETPAEFEKQGQIIVGDHVIPMTKKELVEAGLDPERFGWKSLEQVKHEEIQKAIAHATMGLPKRAIDGVRKIFLKEKGENQRGE